MHVRDLREDIPALEDGRYLNWGASGPSPRPVVERVESTLEHHEFAAPTREGMYPAATDVIEETRSRVAEFVGAEPIEIALTQSTTDGINRVATAMDWTVEDEVVITDVEHSAGRLPWYRLEREYDVTVSVLETDGGRIDLDELARMASEATLVCFSAVDWLYGRRHPVADIVDVVHDAGALSLVDAVQVPGQLPMNVADWGADVVAAAGHKWLLGPWGAGFLYVRREVAEQLEPSSVGYRSVEDPNAADYRFKPGAARFEVATTNPAPYAGLQAAIDVVTDVGIETVTERIRDLTAVLKDGIPNERLRSPVDFHSGLVSVSVGDPEGVVDELADAGVHIRSLPAPETVRVSVHAVNDESDIDAVLEHLVE